VPYLACIAPPPIEGLCRKGGLRCVSIVQQQRCAWLWRKVVFDTVHRGLGHRVTVYVGSAIVSGNSNRAPVLLEHDVESRESLVFEMSESPRLQMQD
jgi:hypothetical protein